MNLKILVKNTIMEYLLIIYPCAIIIFGIISIEQSQKEKQRQAEKKWEKRIFINKFIYEIPELSFYEATQLQQKLGDIYEQWFDE